MSCPVCFFREEYQKKLKVDSFGIERFEKKLRRYKHGFIESARKMESQSLCSCSAEYNSSAMIEWTDALLNALRNAEVEISNAFDIIISVYDDFISRNSKAAADNLWNYLDKFGLVSGRENFRSYNKVLFRARPKGGFDETDINEFFHIPFSKRHKVRGQRFSVSGQPMLYFGSSLLAVVKEMDHNIRDLAVAGFLPGYSAFYNERFFSLANHLSDSIENVLPALAEASAVPSYYDAHTCPNYATVKEDIHRTVLMHLCTFPVEFKDSFVPEYVLPQILTASLLEHGYSGVVFPSTKEFADLSGFHRFSSHHKNIGIFVPYKENEDINCELLNKFSGFCLDGSETFRLEADEVVGYADRIAEITKKSSENNNDCIIPTVQILHHLKYIRNSKVCGVHYYDTEFGKLELEFYMKTLKHLERLVR